MCTMSLRALDGRRREVAHGVLGALAVPGQQGFLRVLMKVFAQDVGPPAVRAVHDGLPAVAAGAVTGRTVRPVTGGAAHAAL
ncbi:hypothetical protein ABZ569_33410 [Streptomyces albus]|uniref:hypothetical protein n=1 Tax=Streptomyces albus TaxID=1888 RepID=UPI0033FF415B